MTLSRRLLLQSAALVCLAGGARAQSTIAAEMMAAGPLPDMSLGKADAPVTVVEYASMTCPHCAQFHETAMPHLKKTYIDTGKVRFVYREFPLDQLAAGVSMLGRCVPGDKFFDALDVFYKSQATWARSDKPLDAIKAVAKQIGFTEDSFKACLTDQKLLDNVLAQRKRGEEKFKVDGTPSFFINGKKADRFHTPEMIDEALKAYL